MQDSYSADLHDLILSSMYLIKEDILTSVIVIAGVVVSRNGWGVDFWSVVTSIS